MTCSCHGPVAINSIPEWQNKQENQTEEQEEAHTLEVSSTMLASWAAMSSWERREQYAASFTPQYADSLSLSRTQHRSIMPR